jgi:hypothetical protein
MVLLCLIQGVSQGSEQSSDDAFTLEPEWKGQGETRLPARAQGSAPGCPVSRMRGIPPISQSSFLERGLFD